MTCLTLNGDWSTAKGKLRQKYAALTDDDLAYQVGREAELIERIQRRVGRPQDEVEQAVSRIFAL